MQRIAVIMPKSAEATKMSTLCALKLTPTANASIAVATA